jgi:hypothetical protein
METSTDFHHDVYDFFIFFIFEEISSQDKSDGVTVRVKVRQAIMTGFDLAQESYQMA